VPAGHDAHQRPGHEAGRFAVRGHRLAGGRVARATPIALGVTARRMCSKLRFV
jgi:hypothetical protein